MEALRAPPLNAVQMGTVRVVFPSTVPIDEGLASRIDTAFRNLEPYPGLGGAEPQRRVTISLAHDSLFSNVRARTDPSFPLVLLPIEASRRWDGSLLGEILRHEYAHIVFFELSGGTEQPRWFSEGYAEWVASPVCQLTIRLRTVSQILAEDRQWAGSWEYEFENPRHEYVLFASVVSHLVERFGESVIRRLLEASAITPFRQAFIQVTGEGMETFEMGWQRVIRSGDDLMTCDVS